MTDSPEGSSSPLTDKEEAFAQQYIIDRNKTQAAIRAGYSPEYASHIGWELLEKTRVKERVSELLRDQAQRTKITADRVLEEIALIAFSDLTDILDIDIEKNKITLKSADQLKGGITRLIKKIKVKDGNFEVELWDKVGGLEKLMRHLGLDQMVVTPPEPAEIQSGEIVADPFIEALGGKAAEVWGSDNQDGKTNPLQPEAT